MTGTTFRVRQVPVLSALRPMSTDAADAPPGMAQLFAQYAAAGQAAIHAPWVGLTTDGQPLQGLFPIRSSLIPAIQ